MKGNEVATMNRRKPTLTRQPQSSIGSDVSTWVEEEMEAEEALVEAELVG